MAAGRSEGLDVGCALAGNCKRDLPEKIAGGEAVHLVSVHQDLHRAGVDEEHAIAGLSCPADELPLLHTHHFEPDSHFLKTGRVDIIKDGQLSNEQESAMGAVHLLRRGLPSIADPGVVETLASCVTLGGVHHKHLGHDILRPLGHFVPIGGWESVLALPNLLEKDGRGIVVEGRETAKHNIKNHAHRPQINLGAVSIREWKVRVQHLWRNVAGRSARRLHH
mmetsp:Transcript_3976/g.8774  ORF Transcript_3976/g.8774 Transcript_3976/m.8774 type:complete len:222 (-) Transcript_3976:694-1359(-)